MKYSLKKQQTKIYDAHYRNFSLSFINLVHSRGHNSTILFLFLNLLYAKIKQLYLLRKQINVKKWNRYNGLDLVPPRWEIETPIKG